MRPKKRAKQCKHFWVYRILEVRPEFSMAPGALNWHIQRFIVPIRVCITCKKVKNTIGA